MLLENVLLCIKSPTTHEHIRLAYGRFRVGKCYVNYVLSFSVQLLRLI